MILVRGRVVFFRCRLDLALACCRLLLDEVGYFHCHWAGLLGRLLRLVLEIRFVVGLLGGALGLVLWGVVAHAWLGYEPDYLSLARAGLVTNAIGQLGDLAMSLIKREAGVKDYSHIFLTHGGMLDRFDSTLFITPWIYLFVCTGML